MKYIRIALLGSGIIGGLIIAAIAIGTTEGIEREALARWTGITRDIGLMGAGLYALWMATRRVTVLEQDEKRKTEVEKRTREDYWEKRLVDTIRSSSKENEKSEAVRVDNIRGLGRLGAEDHTGKFAVRIQPVLKDILADGERTRGEWAAAIDAMTDTTHEEMTFGLVNRLKGSADYGKTRRIGRAHREGGNANWDGKGEQDKERLRTIEGFRMPFPMPFLIVINRVIRICEEEKRENEAVCISISKRMPIKREEEQNGVWLNSGKYGCHEMAEGTGQDGEYGWRVRTYPELEGDFLEHHAAAILNLIGRMEKD